MECYVCAVKKPIVKEWLLKKAVWDACQAAGVSIPEEVLAYFGHNEPFSAEMDIIVGDDDLRAAGALLDDQDEDQNIFKIVLAKLPEGTTEIHFIEDYS